MKTSRIAAILLAFLCFAAAPGFSDSQEYPAFSQALGFSGGLTSGTGFTYRYLQDWGYTASGIIIYIADQNTSQVFFLGSSVMKQLFFYATKDKNFHALLYGFWGATLSGGTTGSDAGYGIGLSTGPGFGVEFGLFQHLAVYTEISQGATFYLLKPPSFAPFDAGILLGGGLAYRF